MVLFSVHTPLELSCKDGSARLLGLPSLDFLGLVCCVQRIRRKSGYSKIAHVFKDRKLASSNNFFFSKTKEASSTQHRQVAGIVVSFRPGT